MRFFEVALKRVLVWMLVGILLVVGALGEWWRLYLDRPPSPWLITALAVIFGPLSFFKVRAAMRELKQIGLGLQGEKAVGQSLERFRAIGYQVFHDIEGEKGNVDHILIGPGGIFAIETKTRSLPAGRKAAVVYDGQTVLVDGHKPDRDPIKQAQACAGHIQRLIRAGAGESPTVRSVVLFPGWWVTNRTKSPGVWVLNPGQLMPKVEDEGTKLTPEQIRLYSSVLKAHLRA